jgi:hypothetical protein
MDSTSLQVSRMPASNPRRRAEQRYWLAVATTDRIVKQLQKISGTKRLLRFRPAVAQRRDAQSHIEFHAQPVIHYHKGPSISAERSTNQPDKIAGCQYVKYLW